MDMPVVLEPQVVLKSLNSDPEFVKDARHWTAVVRLFVGPDNYLIDIADGVVRSITPGWEVLANHSLSLGASEEVWEEILKAEPRPHYHDVFAAAIRHGFIMSGDHLLLFAYYPAIRRMVEVLRLVHNERA
jgi:hypothetical protein